MLNHLKMEKQNLMDDIISLSKRRGFIFPSSEIYGGFANTYTYGPYGVELKNNIKKAWWKMFVQDREDIVGIDGPIILHPKVWEASGHTKNFNDAMVDCKKCKNRFRADHLIEEVTGNDLEGKLEEMTKVLREEKIKCPDCGSSDWTEVRNFNMMFRTEMNGVSEEDVYLRPETAGAIFIEFKNVLDSTRMKIPFGIAQIGKAFRNEIIAGNFIFRLREFEQMEIEYFIDPEEDWQKIFDKWLDDQKDFVNNVLTDGKQGKKIREYEHPKEKLSHYSKKTVDIEYEFPFGFSELFGLAHRGDFDLTQQTKLSGQKLEYLDPKTNKKYIPHVLEPTFGLDRALLVAMLSAYNEEDVKDSEKRVVMKFNKELAPVKVAIFPLLKNKPELVSKAHEIFDDLKDDFVCEFDDNGNIGKRYRRQDEIGTPYCLTIDFDSLKDRKVTVRDRDTMEQKRVEIENLKDYLNKELFETK